MRRWRVGDAEIVRVEDSNFALPSERPAPAWAVPDFVPSIAELPTAFTAIGIRADGLRIVVDPWLADDHPREGDDAADHAARLLDALGEAGFLADDVDLVVNSHVDGTGWNSRPRDAADGGGWVPSFPNARYLFPRAELDAIDRGDDIYGAEGTVLLREAGVVDLVDAVDGARVLSASVRLIDAPGHNDGHVAVQVEDGGQLATIPGHLILSLLQVDDPGIDIGDTVNEVAAATRRSLLGELADRDGLLVTTLIGGPGGGTVRREGAGFRLDATPA